MVMKPAWVWDEEADDGDLAFVSAVDARKLEPESRKQLLALSYPDYLRSTHWDHMRRRALLRAGFQCKRCEASDIRLDVHHLTYDRLGREDEADLIVLCFACHKREHGNADFDEVVQALGRRSALDLLKRGGEKRLAQAAARIRKRRQ